MNIRGELPYGFVTLVSCDSGYLHAHAPAFISSCAKAGNSVHLHVVNPEKNDWEFMKTIRTYASAMVNHNIQITLSSEETDLSQLGAENIRTYYACNRFLVAPELMSRAAGKLSLMITDIDCIFMKHVDEPTEQLGIFFREPLPGTVGWEADGSRVAAGAVYCHHTAQDFMTSVAKRIRQYEYHWFLDQYALNVTYIEQKDKYSCKAFDAQFMDWNFIEGTAIWTGKGDRKYSNQVYLAKKKQFEDDLNARFNLGTTTGRTIQEPGARYDCAGPDSFH